MAFLERRSLSRLSFLWLHTNWAWFCAVLQGLARNVAAWQRYQSDPFVVVVPCLSGGGFGNYLKQVLVGLVYAESEGASMFLFPPTDPCPNKLEETHDVNSYRGIIRGQAEKLLGKNVSGTWAEVVRMKGQMERFVQKFMATLPMAIDLWQQKLQGTDHLAKMRLVNEDCLCCKDFYNYRCLSQPMTGDLLARAAQQYITPHVTCPALPEIGPKTLVLHVRLTATMTHADSTVRADDIYFTSEQCYYPQPPCAYYEDIIASRKWSDIVVVTPPKDRPTEHRTGCAHRIVEEIAPRYGLLVRLQSASEFEDACVLHRAQNLVLSFSSWSAIFGVYLGLAHKRSVFWPFAGGDVTMPNGDTVDEGSVDSFIRYNTHDFALRSPPANLRQCLYAFPQFACTLDSSYRYRVDNLEDYPRDLMKHACSS
mmetsp:Transcript_105110/g.208944  ORF Transcript_105110/g.208944 Transcript_105110/m.208944 type:complete len:424 (-) Transcript_105110:83-1354(-)